MSEFNKLGHYGELKGPVDEFGDLPQVQATIRNIGWTLGNDCPFRCLHCYSMNAREKGKDMNRDMIDRIVEQLRLNGVETVNLGGNEPLYTNGPNHKKTLLPYIIDQLVEAGITVGLTTSGITILKLYELHYESFSRLNDVDISFDSPFEDEHNKNRGAKIFTQAIEVMRICQKENKPHSAIMCGMNWNFTERHLEEMVNICREYDANLRINPVKPALPEHMDMCLTPKQYYDGFSYLLDKCDPIDLGEPPVASVTNYRDAKRCPCGRTSFRIHSITPDGEIYVSPCVYLHDYKSNLDLLKHDLAEIIDSPQFRSFRQRNANPEKIEGCAGCDRLKLCGGGCTARSYLTTLHSKGDRTLLSRDPMCPKEEYNEQPFEQNPSIVDDVRLVHMDYLCTWIGRPK